MIDQKITAFNAYVEKKHRKDRGEIARQSRENQIKVLEEVNARNAAKETAQENTDVQTKEEFKRPSKRSTLTLPKKKDQRKEAAE